MTNTIEASANALKVSYLRFVSDSAPGLLLIGAVLVIERERLLPYFRDDDALKAVAAAALILLATPLGLLINGAGHFCLGGVQEWIERRCFEEKSWPLKGTRDILVIDRWKSYFKMKDDDVPRIAHEVDDLLDTYVPHLAALLEHVRALKKFCRSIAFLALIGLIAAAGELALSAVATLLAGMLVSILTSRWPRGARVAAGPFILGAVAFVAVGCWEQPRELTISLFLLAVGAILLAGFVDFYQHAMTILFVYQLLAHDGDDEGFEISAARVRVGLTALVLSRASQKGGAGGG